MSAGSASESARSASVPSGFEKSTCGLRSCTEASVGAPAPEALSSETRLAWKRPRSTGSKRRTLSDSTLTTSRRPDEGSKAMLPRCVPRPRTHRQGGGRQAAVYAHDRLGDHRRLVARLEDGDEDAPARGVARQRARL